MADIYANNLSAQRIIRQTIARSNKPTNKYNESLHLHTEELANEPNDRTAYDAGMELEKQNSDE